MSYTQTETEPRTALIAGVSGIAGSALAELLESQGWEVYGLARGKVTNLSSTRLIAANLEDREQLREALAGIRPTHVFYTAWKRNATEAENIVTNQAMVRNLVDVVGAAGTVRHVALVTGLKHYVGSADQQGKIDTPDTPFTEDMTRRDVPNFYYAQEDELFAGAKRHGYTWSVHRSHTITGQSLGNAMNMGLTLAVQAAICKEEGLPFAFPGSEVRWNGLGDMTDAGLLAQHMLWAATTPAAANEAFNVVNGDVFRWRSMWPKIAEMLGVEPVGFDSEPRPLAVQMEGREDAWARIADRHGLIERELGRVASWWHTDGDLGRGMEMLADMSKSRLAGFTGYVRTEDCFRELFDFYAANRVIPPLGATAETGAETELNGAEHVKS